MKSVTIMHWFHDPNIKDICGYDPGVYPMTQEDVLEVAKKVLDSGHNVMIMNRDNGYLLAISDSNFGTK